MKPNPVVRLDARRTTRSRVDYAECPCGSAWFVLGSDEAEGIHRGAVALDPTGTRVTGYSGTPHCVECGQEWAPPGGWAAGI